MYLSSSLIILEQEHPGLERLQASVSRRCHVSKQGNPPAPAAISNAMCGPQRLGSTPPIDGSNFAGLNPCPLKVCLFPALERHPRERKGETRKNYETKKSYLTKRNRHAATSGPATGSRLSAASRATAARSWTRQVFGMEQSRIAHHESCRFGVEAIEEHGNDDFKVGGQDVIDIINDVVKKFRRGNGRVGVRGTMRCDGNLKSQVVLWDILLELCTTVRAFTWWCSPVFFG